MLESQVQNSEDLKTPLIISSRKRRIVAFILDHFFHTFLLISIIFAILGPNYLDDNDGFFSTIFFSLLFGFIVYFSKDSFKGISFGKWIMGIMVRDDADRTKIPSYGRLFTSNIFIIIWPVEFIILALDSSKKRLGDKLTKTVVLKNPNKPTKLPRVLSAIGIFSIFIAFLFLLIGNTMKSSDAYKMAIVNIEQNAEIQKETGGITGYGFFPGGNINVSNDEGTAALNITVKGKIKDLEVSTYLQKDAGGQWRVVELSKQ